MCSTGWPISPRNLYPFLPEHTVNFFTYFLQFSHIDHFDHCIAAKIPPNIQTLHRIAMPRKLTESVKRKREAKRSRKIEKPNAMPDHLKQSTIEFLYRIGKEPNEIAKVSVGAFTILNPTACLDHWNCKLHGVRQCQATSRNRILCTYPTKRSTCHCSNESHHPPRSTNPLPGLLNGWV